MKVTIDRATWSAGKHNRSMNEDVNNALFTADSRQRCCLGFLGASLGLTDAVLCGVSVPGDEAVKRACAWPLALFDYAPHVPRHMVRLEWEHVLTTLNDFKDIDDATRESWISEGFRIVLGCEVEYVGEYPEPK